MTIRILRLELRPTPSQNQKMARTEVYVVSPLDNIVTIHKPADGDFNGADVMLSNGHTLRVTAAPIDIAATLDKNGEA